MARTILFLCAILCPITSTAEYKSYGVGNSSCGEWLKERREGDWYSEGQWMLGFISAVGYYSVYNLKETDAHAFAAWLDNYCTAHPLNDISEGVIALVEELRITKKPK